MPSADDLLDHYYKLASGDRFKKYGEFMLLDRIARDYRYSHDEVFNLSWREAYTIHALGLERNYVESKAGEMKRRHEDGS